jgi:hypothetical protein
LCSHRPVSLFYKTKTHYVGSGSTGTAPFIGATLMAIYTASVTPKPNSPYV